MLEVKKNEMNSIEILFAEIEDSMVIACLQGYMGKAYVDKLPKPGFGVIVSGEYSFFAENSNLPLAKEMAENIFEYIEGDSSVAIYSENNLGWRDLLLSIKSNNPNEIARFGIVQKNYDFDKERLSVFMNSIPKGYEIVRFNEEIYNQSISEAWSQEFCETFESAEDYLNKGFGFAVLFKGELVSGASTMTVYDGGFEIQVATNEKHQGHGLGLACASALLLESMKRKVRPCWDAATLISLHMAIKLGYEYKGEYSTVHLHKTQQLLSI